MPVKLLGPFVGFVSDTTAKIWIYKPGISPATPLTLHVIVSSGEEAEGTKSISLTYDNLGADVAVFENLIPDTRYQYKIFYDETLTEHIELDGLKETDLFFRTMPVDPSRIDFLLMSCHNPTKSKTDAYEGYRIWATMPQVIDQNPELRFAIMGGDQIYADDEKKSLLEKTDERTCIAIYLGVYEQYWSNIHYRRVLARMPAVLMWDDHDIMDGWGSDVASFKSAGSEEFRSEWLRMFKAAHTAFGRMQALRNPERLLPDSYDCAFRVGRLGFFMSDLRTNRNLHRKEIWSSSQFAALKKWVKEERDNLEVLFFCSSVVFTHGSEKIDATTVKNWGWVQDLVKGLGKEGKGIFGSAAKWFEEELGDLRDDIRDSWGAEENAEQTEELLKYLFSLQNPTGDKPPIRVVILSGDIHAGGYSTLYSTTAKLTTGEVIPHIVSSPVSYAPFKWLLEGAYRSTSDKVAIGTSGKFYAQVSHHYCKRNVAVISVRRKEAVGDSSDQLLLKVKYYLEDYPEPQIVIFDLINGSHVEGIEWPTKK